MNKGFHAVARQFNAIEPNGRERNIFGNCWQLVAV